MRHKIIRLSFGAIALGCIALFMIGMTPADAEPWGFQNKGLCSKVGMWHGAADLGITWMAVNTPGQNAFNGQMTLEWVLIDPTLGAPPFSNTVRVTNAYGVWKKAGWRTYLFTWIGYGLDEGGGVVYTARASGEGYLVDCDHVDIDYVLEVWLAGDDISMDPPLICVEGTAEETRMPLVQASRP
jgi:hypothetical protein